VFFLSRLFYFVLCLLAPDKQRIYRVKFRVRFKKRLRVIRNFVFWCQYFFETFLRERRVPANGGASPARTRSPVNVRSGVAELRSPWPRCIIPSWHSPSSKTNRLERATLCDPAGMRPSGPFYGRAELRRPNFPSHAIADCGLR